MAKMRAGCSSSVVRNTSCKPLYNERWSQGGVVRSSDGVVVEWWLEVIA